MRGRIVRLTVMAAVLAICLFGLPLAIAVARYFVADERGELERLADTAAISVSGDLGRAELLPAIAGRERGTQIAVYDPAGNRVAGDGPPRADRLVGGALHGAISSGRLGGRLAVAVPVSDGDTVAGAVLATTGTGAAYARIGLAWLAMVGLGGAAAAMSWLLARRQARRLTRPLEAVSVAAERLGGGDFSIHAPHTGVAEIDSVSVALNRTADRLGSLVERERAFSADASHQLRTPLTGLRLGLESALDNPDSDHRATIREALAAADQLENIVTDLLALARDQPRESDPLDIAELVRSVRERWNGRLAAKGRPLRFALSDPLPGTRISTPAVTHILEVLLDNADRHGRGAITVTVRAASDAVAFDVATEGPPLSGDPRELFLRRSPSANGHGIGLALARRLAESEGGRLRLTNADPPTFTLLVPGTP